MRRLMFVFIISIFCRNKIYNTLIRFMVGPLCLAKLNQLWPMAGMLLKTTLIDPRWKLKLGSIGSRRILFPIE